MKFKLLLEELLNEMSPIEVYQKYYNKIPYKKFLSVVSYDPQTIINNGEIIRFGKYSKLLIHLYTKGRVLMEDMPNAEQYLQYVYKHNVPLDIKKIQSLNDLYEIVKIYIVRGSSDLNKLPTD